MKTMKDIEILINTKGMFGTGFESLLFDLENDYISKSNGIERISSKLNDWDKESKEYIINGLIKILKNGFLMDFNPNELLALI